MGDVPTFLFLLGHTHNLLRSVLHAVFAQQIHSLTWQGNELDLFGGQRIKFQWSKEKQNRVRPSAGGRSRRKSHKPNNKLRPERTQHRFNNQENDSISADNVIASPSYSDAPIQLQSEQKRISRHDEALFIESQAIQQQRRPSHRSHDQRRCSRKSEKKLSIDMIDSA